MVLKMLYCYSINSAKVKMFGILELDFM
jgi:hypothetical protein